MGGKDSVASRNGQGRPCIPSLGRRRRWDIIIRITSYHFFDRIEVTAVSISNATVSLSPIYLSTDIWVDYPGNFDDFTFRGSTVDLAGLIFL
jgi:hypothetical protein